MHLHPKKTKKKITLNTVYLIDTYKAADWQPLLFYAQPKAGKDCCNVVEATIIFPHQLFRQHPALEDGRRVYIVAEHLFFNQFPFLKQKLIYTLTCMLNYQHELKAKDYEVKLIESKTKEADIRELIPRLKKEGIETIHLCDVCDDWLHKRLIAACNKSEIQVAWYQSSGFLNSLQDITEYADNKDGFYHASFYTAQRKKRKILLEKDGSPVGGKWSFDTENRKPLPNHIRIPSPNYTTDNEYIEQAKAYINKHYANNAGGDEIEWESGSNGWFPYKLTGYEILAE